MRFLALQDAEQVQLLTCALGPQRNPTHNSPESANYLDFSSGGSGKSQPDTLAHLAANVMYPLERTFGNTLNVLASDSSNDVLTTGDGGNQSSTTGVFPLSSPTRRPLQRQVRYCTAMFPVRYRVVLPSRPPTTTSDQERTTVLGCLTRGVSTI